MGNIKNEQNCNVRCEKKSSSVQKKPVVGFLKWWLIFTGIYSVSSVCPFCGQAGCPVGLGSASIVGGFFALFMQNWKQLLQKIYSKFYRFKSDISRKKMFKNQK